MTTLRIDIRYEKFNDEFNADIGIYPKGNVAYIASNDLDILINTINEAIKQHKEDLIK